jgi:peroxiredoxin
MVTTLCLFTCAVLAQQADRGEWLLSPRLGRGQELVYTGTFTREDLGQGVQCKRSYHFETYVFVLDSLPQGCNVALLTILELQALRPDQTNSPPPRSVRLELARIDPQGRVEATGKTPLLVPLEGPPTVEHGAFVEVPHERVDREHPWQANEPGRPPRFWQIAGSDRIDNTLCLKLAGTQQSEDWDKPRADSTAWMRTDTVWLAPSLGFAYRVERKIVRRDPFRNQPTQQSLLRYDLLSRLTYPSKLYDDRRREIMQAHRFAEEAAPLLRNRLQFEHELSGLLKRIATCQTSQPGVEPYSKAVAQVKSRIEAALRGETAPDPESEPSPVDVSMAVRGKRAPDFVATDLIRRDSVRLRRLLGKPMLIVFFNPAFDTAPEVLRFAAEQQRRGVTVLGMAVSDDVGAVRKRHAELHLTFPILAGKGFNRTYGVTVTPRLVVLDADGFVRGTFTGWGTETPREVREELDHCLRKSVVRSP